MNKKTTKSSGRDGNIVNVFTWGTGEGGQLGYGSGNRPVSQDVPRPVLSVGAPEDRNAISAAAGGRHSLFLLRSGVVLACGVWDNGQIGCLDRPIVHTLETERDKMRPIPKSLIPRGTIDHPVTVNVSQKVVVQELAAGFASSFLLTDFGEVWSWGQGKYGCLGLGDDTDRWYPEPIPLFEERQPETVTQISAGKWHAVCLTQTNKVYAWGRNNWGQIGTQQTSESENSPVQITLAAQESPVQVSAGTEHSVAVIRLFRPNKRQDTVAYAWGNPANGRLGSNREHTHPCPMEVEDLTQVLRKRKQRIVALAAGGTHTLAVLASGEMAAWGGGGYGQLGDGHMWDRPESVMVAAMKGAKSASAGLRHSVALTIDAGSTHIWSWGFNRWGELGCGDCRVRLQPQRVSGLSGCVVKRVVAGERHTIALTNGKAKRVNDLPEYRGFIDAYKKGGLLVYDALKRTMAEKGLNPDWLDSLRAFFPGQPGMTDTECRQGMTEPFMEWCMDTAPPGKDIFDSLRGGHEIAYVCYPCRRQRVCLACARKCHASHKIEPTFRLRNSAEPCDCSDTRGMCTCKWSPMRDHFQSMSAEKLAAEKVGVDADGWLHPSQLRELLQIVRGGAAFVTSDDVDDGIAQLTRGGERERIDFLSLERWYEEYFGKIDAMEELDS